MRLSFVLPATMIIAYFVACNATVDSKISTVGSSDSVHSSVRKLCRQKISSGSQEGWSSQHGGARLQFFRGETSASKVEVDPVADAVETLAKEILENPKMAKGAYLQWKHAGHTLDDLKKWFKIEEEKKYLSIYNGYVFHKFQN